MSHAEHHTTGVAMLVACVARAGAVSKTLSMARKQRLSRQIVLEHPEYADLRGFPDR